MGFYDEMAATTTQLISEFGQDVIISTIQVEKKVDPVSGEVILPEVRKDYTVKGIMKKYPENLIDGSRIMYSDRQLMLEASVIEPQMTDKITIDGQLWPIMEIQSINPAGTPLLYIVHVRG